MLDIFIVDISRQTSLGNYINDLFGVLDNYEVIRFNGIRNAIMKERYLTCRYILREVISRYTNQKMFDVNFEYSFFGKPIVRGQNNIEFNLSHSGNDLVIGVSDEELGVDIENVRPVNMDVARCICTKNELLHIYHESNVYDRFFRLWTLKEAYAKKIGEGFYFNFKNIEFSLSGSKVSRFKINNCVSESVDFFTKEIGNNILSICSKKKNKAPKIMDFY